jgi:hypothetical protein
LTPFFKRKVERLEVEEVLNKKATKATPID